MQISVTLPDEIAKRLQQQWGNLPHRVLETLVVEAYRSEAITRSEVRQLLGLSSRFEVDAFLKKENVCMHYDISDFEQDMETMEKLRSKKLLR